MKNSDYLFQFAGMMVTLPLIGFAIDAQAAKRVKQPNIIMIISDDQGYADYSYRCPDHISTPNIDKLKSESMFFNNFYVEPASAPTRASLLTGRSFVKTGVTSVHWGFDYINQEETLISEVMKNAGYETAIIGKWHSGKGPGYLPMDRGFDHVVSATMHTHLNSDMCWNDTPALLGGKSPYYVQKEKKGWTVDRMADAAIDYIDTRNGEKPFFMMLTYVAPHGPWIADPNLVEKYKKMGQTSGFANLNALIEQMDGSIGRVLEALDESKFSDNTIVIFFSDNGYIHTEPRIPLTEKEIAMRNPDGLRGTKGTIFEGGVLSPMIFRWRGVVEPGTNDRLSHVTDMLPTLSEIAGVKHLHTAFKLDGISFFPDLLGKKKTGKNRVIFSSFLRIPSTDYNSMAKEGQNIDSVRAHITYDEASIYARNERFKLVKQENNFWLYDMAASPCEKEDVSAEYPKVKKKLQKEMRAYYEDVITQMYSYNKPMYYPGKYQYTVIYFNGAGILTGDFKGVGPWAHCLSASVENASATWRISVAKDSEYEVWLEAKTLQDTKVKLSSESNELETNITKGELHCMGRMKLSANDNKLEFRLREGKEVPELWNIILKKI